MISGLLLFKDKQNLESIFSSSVRDHLSDHWREMKSFFFKNAINLEIENNQSQPHSFEIHIDVNNKRIQQVPAFLLVWENKNIFPENLDSINLKKYYRIFSHDTQTKIFTKASKFFLPAFRSMKVLPNGYLGRKKLLVMIANNKSLPNFNNKYNLYSERVKTIRWFEKNHPDEFYLYGSGWDKSARMPTMIGGLIHKIEEKIFPKKFKFNTWNCIIEEKSNVLSSSKFSIVYENVSGQYDYITEKIFDAFSFANVPIYWGAKNILDHVPKSCFIDRRDFISHESLYKYIKNMKEEKFIRYQENIKNYLYERKNNFFSIENFIKTVPKQIILDLKSLKII
jgi:hypothetical protein